MMSKKMEPCDYLPHQGSMCLVSEVLEHDKDKIICVSSTHNEKTNPLLDDGVLSSVMLIEYAAQACGIHKALNSETGDISSTKGVLANVRDISIVDMDVSLVHERIVIAAEVMLLQDNGAIYSFNITAGTLLLVSGRLTLIFQE